MSVFKRTTSKGETAEYHFSFMVNGKRFFGVCEGCTTKEAAEKFEKHQKEIAKKGATQKTAIALIENFREELTGGSKILLKDAFALYLDKPARRNASEKQINVNRSYFADFVMFMAKTYPEVENLSNVRKNHAEAYISLLRKSGAFSKTVVFYNHLTGKNSSYELKAEKLSARTINARHKAIKAVFSRLFADAGLIENPFDIVCLASDTQSREAFNDEELKKIADNMSMPFTQPIFTIGLCTGLTLGDICLLKWKEIEGNWITNKIRRKTGVSVEIPILPPLAAFLSEQRKISGNQEYVCPELAKMYLENTSGVFYRLRTFLQSIGIEQAEAIEGRSRKVSTKAAHAMRHTFAYLAGVYNVPQPIVQGILGHLSPKMAALYQKHAQREQKEKFLNQMPIFQDSIKKLESRKTALLKEFENFSEDELEKALEFLKSK